MAIPLAERLSIQNDLAWTGDYNGAINGEFGERAIAAVKAFQKRNGGKETGVLNQPERAALAAAAKPKQDAVGWRMVDDLMTGARIGIPTKLVPNTHFSAGVGKWSSSRGEYSVETFRITQPGTTLPAVFERMKKEPAGRKPDYSVLRAGLLRHLGPAEPEEVLRARAGARRRGARLHGALRSGDGRHHGAGGGRDVERLYGVSRRRQRCRRRAARSSMRAASRSAPGHIVTSRDALDGCYVVTVAGIGGADRVAEDKRTALRCCASMRRT